MRKVSRKSNTKDYLVDTAGLKPGFSFYFNRGGLSMEAVRDALRAQYPLPGGKDIVTSSHGQTTYVGARDGVNDPHWSWDPIWGMVE